MHHRIRSSEFTVPREFQIPDSFRDEYHTTVISSLPPYADTHALRDVDDKNMSKNPRMLQAAGRSGTTERKAPVASKATGSKIAYYYDLTYHYMKRHWIIFCAVILATIVSGSLAIGWAFRLKTFNIADPGSMAHSIVRMQSMLRSLELTRL